MVLKTDPTNNFSGSQIIFLTVIYLSVKHTMQFAFDAIWSQCQIIMQSLMTHLITAKFKAQYHTVIVISFKN